LDGRHRQRLTCRQLVSGATYGPPPVPRRLRRDMPVVGCYAIMMHWMLCTVHTEDRLLTMVSPSTELDCNYMIMLASLDMTMVKWRARGVNLTAEHIYQHNLQ
jgi:hypothetical protein